MRAPASRSSYIAELRLAEAARSLYGRDEELACLRAKLASGARVVTLFGPAGIGKTALATALARLYAEDARVVFVDLSEVDDRVAVCGALGRALDVPLDRRREPSTEIAGALRAHDPTVVVLDSCDRAVDAVAELLRGWLARSVPAVFVITSREVLGLTDEHAYEVGPLAVPAPGACDSDAVAFFMARAAQSRREALRSADPEVIADIVRSLEGIPLALELAASRLSVLSPLELRARLSTRLGVLSSRLRREHPRQRTMHAAIEWSWTRLEAHEQAALRQLSVFRGGFDVRAAEEVIDAAALDGVAVVDVLQSLRAKSFIRGDEAGGDVRLGQYEVIRDFGEQALRDAGEEAGAVTRHAAYFVARSEDWGRAIGTGGEGAALERLSEEIDNLRAVHSRALEGLTACGVADAFRVIVGLRAVMWTRLPAQASLALVDAALGSPTGRDVPIALRCEVLLCRSHLLELMGRAEARVPAEEALSLARASGNARLEAAALARLGSIDVTRGDVRGGSDTLREALTTLPELEPRLAANGFSALGTALRTMGDVEGARAAHEDALAIRARLGDERGACADVACLAALHFQQGDLEEARVLVEDALARSARFGDRYTGAYAGGVLGAVLAELGLHEEAMARYEEALGELERLGERRLYGVFLGYSAAVRQLSGARVEAAEAYRAALAILRDQGDRLHEGLIAGAASTLAWEGGEAGEAEALYALASDRLTELSASVNGRLGRVLSLHLGHRDLWMHRTALAAGDDRGAKAQLEAARRRMIAAAAGVDDHDDLRLACRLLQNALDGQLPPPRGAGELELEPDALWFRFGFQPRVDLRRRRAPRLVLRALVEQRLRAPGVPVPMDRLLAMGWPGEKMLPQAGLSRLYVTVRSLRDLGLRSALLHQDDGYLLDPSVPLVGIQAPPKDDSSEGCAR